MIGLGSILLAKEGSIVDARKKVRDLAQALNFDPIKVVRIATATSELIRCCLRSRNSVRLALGVGEYRNQKALNLVFEDCDDAITLGRARDLFGGAALSINSAGGRDIWMAELLPDPEYQLTEEFIDMQTQRIADRSKADELLRAILPDVIADELTVEDRVQSRRHSHVAVLFTDIVGFTKFCDSREPDEVVTLLEEITDAFETISTKHQLDKIKTIGDAYLAAAGLLKPLDNPVLTAVKCGLEMLDALKGLSSDWTIRVGIHSGPVIAGIVGKERFSYDLWGDTVNTASRVESNGEPGYVNLSETAFRQCMGDCVIADSKTVIAKGKGEFRIFHVEKIREVNWNPSALGDGPVRPLAAE